MSDARQTSASPAEPVTLQAGSDSDRGVAAQSKVNNEMAHAGFILALVAFPLIEVGIVQILGLVLSCIGLHTFDPATQKDKCQARVGLVLNFLETVGFLLYFTMMMRGACVSR